MKLKVCHCIISRYIDKDNCKIYLETILDLNYHEIGLKAVSVYKLRCQSVCLGFCAGIWNHLDCRLLVKEHINIVAKLRNLLCYFPKTNISVLANQPTVHSGGVSRGRVCGCSCLCWWHETCDSWNLKCFIFFKFFVSVSLWEIHIHRKTWPNQIGGRDLLQLKEIRP